VLAIAEKLTLTFPFLRQRQRGDVVLLQCPDRPGVLVVKRVIALEGDWIMVPGDVDVQRIPKGHCWVEGDNAALSEDSRSKYGPVPAALIEGRVVSVVWPPQEVGLVEAKYPHSRLLVRNAQAFSSDDG